MTERLIELIRALAKDHPKDPRAKELMELVGTDGDAHEASQRHPSGVTAKTKGIPKDSSLSSETWNHGHGDEKYVPGDGVYVSRIHLNIDTEYWHRSVVDKGGMFVPEKSILAWAKEINLRRRLDAVAAEYREGLAERLQKCHPGTDAEDAGKGGLHRVSDDYEVDHSRSTLYISACSSTGSWLNGSAVQHHRYITMHINGPDGRRLVEVGMTFEQFAAALVSNSFIPCTLEAYWSIGEGALLLRERMRPAPSIKERLDKRVRAQFDDKFQWMKDCIKTMEENVAAGKALSKTAQAEMAGRLKNALSQLADTPSYAVERSLEEVTSIVESAAIHLSQTYRLPPEELAKNKAIATLIEKPALPAPKPK